MSLFSKKLTLDDILKGIDSLSDDDKRALRAKIEDLDKAEDEREIDKIEEEKATDPETEEDKGEDVNEESEEIGKDVDEIEEEAAEDGDPVAEAAEEEKAEEETEEKETEDHHDDTAKLYEMVSDLKKTVEALAARMDADAENGKEEEEDPFSEFGISPKDYGTEDEESSEVEKMKAKYWNM